MNPARWEPHEWESRGPEPLLKVQAGVPTDTLEGARPWGQRDTVKFLQTSFAADKGAEIEFSNMEMSHMPFFVFLNSFQAIHFWADPSQKIPNPSL